MWLPFKLFLLFLFVKAKFFLEKLSKYNFQIKERWKNSILLVELYLLPTIHNFSATFTVNVNYMFCRLSLTYTKN